MVLAKHGISQAFYRQKRLRLDSEGCVGCAEIDLSLRFPMFWGPRTLSLHPCAAKSPKAELSLTPRSWFFMAFGP